MRMRREGGAAHPVLIEAHHRRSEIAKPGQVEVVFKDLAPGSYAVSAYQDLNGNQRLDANMVGMPTEPFGFSRDAKGQFGPPKFDDAVIKVSAEPQRIQFKLSGQ